MRTRPYRPANGTEGMIFDDAWCSRCEHDRHWRETGDDAESEALPCPILSSAFLFNIGDPEYPAQWIEDDVEWPTSSNPRCTAFQEIGKEGSTFCPDERQMELPLLAEEQQQ